MKNPLKYAKRLTDPVTQKRFGPTKHSPRTTYMGRAYYFASESSFVAFRATPDSFAIRRGM